MAEGKWEEVGMVPAWDFKTQKTFVGVYRGFQENVGENNSNLYGFDTKDGRMVVWGNTMLDTRFGTLEFGDEVKIEYKGQEKSKKSERSYHNFDVFKRKAVFEEEEDTSTPSGDEEVDPAEVTA